MYLIVSIQAVGITMVIVGFGFSILLGYIACDTIEKKQDTIKAYALVISLLIIVCGGPIAGVLLKPLTVAYFGWSKTLALIVGYTFHAIVVTVGAIIGTMKRHDVI